MQTSILAYLTPVIICLGFLYFDSAIHKLSSDHWRNGLGAWLPSSLPYYISAIDMSWLLNREFLQKSIGYTIIVFQFAFLLLYFSSRFRPIAFLIGISLHLGITLTFNIYPFGLGMLALYPLVAPFSWWRRFAAWLKNKQPALTVYYDEECPLCNRTVITINHFDIFNTIDFKGLQTHAESEPALRNINNKELLTDLYAVDGKGKLYQGVDTYIRILAKMRYPLLVSLILRIPGIYHIADRYYRRIADKRIRHGCGNSCMTNSGGNKKPFSIYRQIFEKYASKRPHIVALRLSKIFIFICILQLNSTLHYGLAYRLGLLEKAGPLSAPFITVSNSILTLTTTFLGISPHALYLHDHFKGYNHIIGITYIDVNNNEKWLPFINEQGRIIAPNWGRVHSMWANIAVTPHINNYRLTKLLKKVTAFWAVKSGLDLDKTRFIIKLKKIQSPPEWVANLRYNNLAQPWISIGYAQWSGKEMTINLPDNIEAL